MRRVVPRAPQHLWPRTRRWWRLIVREWGLEEHEQRLLTVAAEAWEREQTARAVLAQEGMTYINRYGGPVARPEVGIARDAAVLFAKVMKDLDLREEEPQKADLRRNRKVVL